MPSTSTPFVILFLGRSGSSYLVSILNSHPDICCRFEDFGTIGPEHSTRQLHRFSGETEDNPTRSEIHQHLNSIFQRPSKASGFKLKFPSQYFRFPEVLLGLLRRKARLKVLFLDRQDVVKRIVSLKNLEIVREKEDLISANRVNERKNEKFEIDIPRFLNRMLVETHRRAELNALTRQFPNRLRVEYDDLLKSKEATLLRITEFLGVDPMPGLDSKFKKATPDDLSLVVKNFSDLQAALKSFKAQNGIVP